VVDEAPAYSHPAEKQEEILTLRGNRVAWRPWRHADGRSVPVIIDTTSDRFFPAILPLNRPELLELVCVVAMLRLGDLIVGEILQGVETDKEFRLLKRQLQTFQPIPW